MSNNKQDDKTKNLVTVKSTAVVKYMSIQPPPSFLQLQPNTNLKLPPANWLHGRTKYEHFLQDMSNPKPHSSFSSFNMANSFPEMAGDVDVISDSQNIKQLLKIPYTKGVVSMMVHRIGNSLLLDQFDIHKHLLRQQQEDWQWLKKFYDDTITQNLQEKEKYSVKKKKSRDHLQKQDMFSKFLYYSVADNEEANEAYVVRTSDPPHSTATMDDQDHTIQALPDPLPQEETQGSSEFQRNVMWTFEDIRMLIGTDLPIFGGGTHPCVSLRLRDMRKPINILTGIDYWLDNLMCNVPELAMCYHLDGLVQAYELVKTEDIPNLEGSKFSQNVVKDIAQNILYFLKSNATKQGHTYWLFKGNGDDIVKLYDLTTLCSDIVEDRSQNPFTVPVGILLYRVARNMRQRTGRKHSGTVHTLLKNALILLDKEKHSQLVTSANYLLSDLYVSDDISVPAAAPSSGSSDESDLEDEPTQTADEDVGEEECHMTPGHAPASPATTSVDVQTLCVADKVKRSDPRGLHYPPVCGDTEERCKQALQHIAQGLKCLDMNANELMKASDHICDHLEESAKRCPDPNKAIPMHYQPLFKSSGTQKQTNEDGASSKPQNTSTTSPSTASFSPPAELLQWRSNSNNELLLPHNSWHCLSKTLLLRKAAIAYYGLAELRMQLKIYGQAMRFLKLALRCFETVQKLLPTKAADISYLLCSILSLCGDAHLMFAHNTNQAELFKEDLSYMNENDIAIINSINKQLIESGYDWLKDFTPVAHLNLLRGERCYEESVDIVQSDVKRLDQYHTILKRLGNVRNELGVHYMNESAQLMNDSNNGDGVSSLIQQTWKKSFHFFENAIEAFQKVNDKINMALMYSNTGRLMRLCAQANTYPSSSSQGKREFSMQERYYFNKAIENYQLGVQMLELRSFHPDIWDSVTWELSSSYFTMATYLQDNAPLSTSAQEQVEKEVTDLMTKALKFCDTETVSMRQPMCQYRAATIHHRLASLYHNAYRNQAGEQKRKHLRMLAELHYDKACRLFTVLESFCEQLRVQLERVAMCEFQISKQTASSSKLKSLKMALWYLLGCTSSLTAVCQHLSAHQNLEIEGYHDELTKLLSILQSRITFVILNLIKNLNAIKKSKPSDLAEVSILKKMYARALKNSSDSTSPADLATRCRQVLALLNDLKELHESSQTSQSNIPTT